MRIGNLVVGDLTEHLAASDVRIDRTADDGAGTHDRDLDGEVVEVAGAGASQHLDLGSALDLEDADGVTRADAVVDDLVLEVDA